MRVIGLTGGIGSGKSTVARFFQELGVHAVDADIVAREVVEPGTQALARIAKHFGTNILTPDGALDRAALRQIVFETPAEREWLENLLHPIIRNEIRRQLWLDDEPAPPNYPHQYVLLVSPLLLETDQHQLTDKVIVVDVPVETQIERTMSRDQNNRDQVERIIAAQMPRKDRLQKADHVVDNTQPLAVVEDEVKALNALLDANSVDQHS